MNANSSDKRLYVAIDQCTIFSSGNHAQTNVIAALWLVQLAQERSARALPGWRSKCQEDKQSNYASEHYKLCHLLHKNLLIIFVYLCCCGMVY